MPIIELPSEESPLSQGEILEGVNLFATQDSWLESGGEAAKSPCKMCLVLSRPCAITHKPHIVVAGINKYPDNLPKDINDFEKVLSFLTRARDGDQATDTFYLGQLPNQQGRFCARLDSVYTIQIPTNREELLTFLAEKRIAALHPSFARDLHCRIFEAFASLGFEDHGWFSNDDLNWLVSQGQTDIAEALAKVEQLRTKKASREAAGQQFSEKELTNAERNLAKLQESVAPFADERNRRQNAND